MSRIPYDHDDDRFEPEVEEIDTAILLLALAAFAAGFAIYGFYSATIDLMHMVGIL